ncbi:hypothetical protein DFH06DRAFT_1323771 [Mycena polygramma]|nr:hypothetical protein DFH06DRAFT_1323771 [Mycena polygramma]
MTAPPPQNPLPLPALPGIAPHLFQTSPTKRDGTFVFLSVYDVGCRHVSSAFTALASLKVFTVDGAMYIPTDSSSSGGVPIVEALQQARREADRQIENLKAINEFLFDELMKRCQPQHPAEPWLEKVVTVAFSATFIFCAAFGLYGSLRRPA